MSNDMITITFTQVKIEISIKGLTFDTLENMIFDIIQKITQIVFAKVLSDIDCYMRKNRRCGQLKNTGKRKKTFLTRFGDVSITRTRYLEKSGKARYLLDEALSTIKNQCIIKNFMYNFSLRAEEEISLSQSEKHYFGGDVDTWITSGIRDYFPQATFILCRFHLFKRLRESLPCEKDKQRIIKGLLLPGNSGQDPGLGWTVSG